MNSRDLPRVLALGIVFVMLAKGWSQDYQTKAVTGSEVNDGTDMNLERLDTFNFHPNGLALQLAAYLCVMVWKFSTGGWLSKAICSILGIVSVIVVFLASSRGAIVAILAGCGFLISIVFCKAVKRDRRRTLRLSAVFLACWQLCLYW